MASAVLVEPESSRSVCGQFCVNILHKQQPTQAAAPKMDAQ